MTPDTWQHLSSSVKVEGKPHLSGKHGTALHLTLIMPETTVTPVTPDTWQHLSSSTKAERKSNLCGKHGTALHLLTLMMLETPVTPVAPVTLMTSDTSQPLSSRPQDCIYSCSLGCQDDLKWPSGLN